MFSSFRPGTGHGSYQSMALETAISQASPHDLIAMLFSGAMKSIAQARHALQAGSVASKGEATSRAVRIIEEGLKAALDDRGGDLTTNLRALYEYMNHRLLSANIANDDAQYEEVATMLGQLQDAWNAIAGHANKDTVAA